MPEIVTSSFSRFMLVIFSRLAQVRQDCILDHSCSYSSEGQKRNFLPPATKGNLRMPGSYRAAKISCWVSLNNRLCLIFRQIPWTRTQTNKA